MKYVKIIAQVGLLYGIFLIGNELRHLFHLPLPGSMIGLLLLWGALSFKILPLHWIESGAYVFLATLPLYFIPATVGVMDYGHIFVGKGFLLIPITIISTIATLWIASYVSQVIAKKIERKKEEPV